MDHKKIIATIEARLGSTRLPGKVLLRVAGKELLLHMVERVRRSSYIDSVVLAIAEGEENRLLVDFAEKNEILYFSGSENNVLLRVVETAKHYRADILVQLTGDCPLMDPAIIDECIKEYINNDCDYVANDLIRTYPIGFDVAVFATDLLTETLTKGDLDEHDKEHVTTYIVDRPEEYRLYNVRAPSELDRPDLSVTLDTKEDYKVIKKIFNNFYSRKPDFDAYDIIEYLSDNPDISSINRAVARKPKKV